MQNSTKSPMLAFLVLAFLLAASFELAFAESELRTNDWYKKYDVEDSDSRDYLNGSTKSGYKQFNRAWNFKYQRAFPNGNIPFGYQMQQYETLKQTIPGFGKNIPDNQSNGKGGNSINDAANWQSVGSAGTWAGRIASLAIDPNDGNTIYVGAATGGIWKTTNGGNTWNALDDNIPNLAIGALAIHPTNSQFILAGTGEGPTRFQGIGMLQSTNGGQSWSPHSLNFTYDDVESFYRIEFHPTSPDTIWAATTKGLWKFDGAVWSNIPVDTLPSFTNFTDFSFNPNDPSIVLCAMQRTQSSPAEIYRSTNHGNTWTAVSGIPDLDVRRIQLDWASKPGVDSVAFAIVSDSTNNATKGIYRTTDFGATWNLSSGTDLVEKQGGYNLEIITDRGNELKVYVGGFGWWRSSNGGQGWAKKTTQSNIPPFPSNYVHTDQHIAIRHPSNTNTFFVGCDGGLFKTTNDFDTFTDISNGLDITQFNFIDVHPNTPVDGNFSTISVIGGTQDNGLISFQNNPSQEWTRTGFSGDGGKVFYNYNNPNIVYATHQNFGFVTSNDGGNTWGGYNTPFGNDRMRFYGPMEIDLFSPTTLYAGTFRIWRTTDGMATWDSLSTDLTADSTDVISAIGVSPNTPNKIITGTARGNIMMTMDSYATNPTNITGTLPTRFVSDIAIHPTNNAKIYLTYSGFSGVVGTGHVFRTDNNGGIWNDITPPGMDLPVNTIIIDPSLPENIYIGTDLGIFHSPDEGQTWFAFDDGLPNAVVTDLKIQEIQNSFVPAKLVAATYGRGVWFTDLTRPNLTEAFPTGWTNSIVPRNNGLASTNNCQLPTVLTSNTNTTFLNFANINDGDGGTDFFTNRVFLDGELLNLTFSQGLESGGIQYNTNLGPFTIKGGRHTFTDSIDVFNNVFETDETDNGNSVSFIFEPLPLASHVPEQRTAPPEIGTGFFPNCDGFSYAKNNFAFGIGMLPINNSDDYDLRLYGDYYDSEYGFSLTEATSESGTGSVELVFGTYQGTVTTLYPAVFSATSSPTSSFFIEAASSSNNLVIETIMPYTFSAETISANHILDVYEVEMTAGENYDFILTNISGNADLATSVYSATSGLYGKTEFEMIGDLSGNGGNESFTFTPTVSGWHIFSVWKKHQNDLSKDAVYDLEVRKEPSNLAPAVPLGWDFHLVPTNFSGSTPTNVILPQTLVANDPLTPTYFNAAIQNIGDNPTPQFGVEFFIDDEFENAKVVQGGLGSNSLHFENNLQILSSIKGGRHTVMDSIDKQDLVIESNENDNVFTKQYIWEPYILSYDTPVQRTAPPKPNSTGYVYFNCDGFEFDFQGKNGTAWWLAAGTIPTTSSADIDIRTHNDYTGSLQGFGANLSQSGFGSGETDFVIVNGNIAPKTSYYFGVLNINETNDDFYIEAGHETALYFAPDSVGYFSLGSNSVVDVHEVYFSPSNLGTYDFVLTNINGNADLGISLYSKNGDFFKKSDYFTDANGDQAVSYLNGNGQDEIFKVEITESGYYGLAVWKKSNSDLGISAAYHVEIRESIGDFAPTTPIGWDFPITPTDFNGTTFTLPSTLNGNLTGGTFVNLGFTNLGPSSIETQNSYKIEYYLDDVLDNFITTFDNVNVNEEKSYTGFPSTVKGGRHTYGMFVDSEDSYAEIDELNNTFYKQFVWSPLDIGNGTPITRTSPPKKNSTGAIFPNSDGFETSVNLAQIAVVGIIPEDSNDDFDVRLHNDYTGSQNGFSTALATSGFSAGKSDFVFASGANQALVGDYFAGVTNENSGTGNFVIQSKVTASTISNNGTNGTFTLGANEIFEAYKVQLFANNTYYFLLNPTNGNANLGFSLYPNSSPSQKGKGDFVAFANSNNGNGGEVFSFTPTNTTFYDLVVWKDGSNDLPLTSDYEIIVTQTPIHNFTITANGLVPTSPVNLNYSKFGQVQNVQISGEFSDFVDDGTNVNLSSFTFAGTDERFMTQDQNSWSNVTASFSATVNYFRQWRNTFTTQVFAGGVPLSFGNNATFERTLFGAKQTVTSSSSTQFFADDSSVVIVFNETTGSTSDERWAINDFAIPMSLGQITSGSNTIPVTFFHQLKPNVNLVGTDVANTTDVWDRLSFGSLAPEFGVHTSWTGFCDRGSLLAFETFTSQNYTTNDTTIFTVDSAFDTTITYAQNSPTLPPITDVSISVQNGDVHLVWTPVAAAIAYNVYATDGTNVFYLGTATSPDFLDVGAVGNNEMRFYTVTAIDSFVSPSKEEGKTQEVK